MSALLQGAADLDAALLAAHARRDAGALIGLYTKAGEAAQSADAACFYFTQAFIFALEAGDARALSLQARLHALGREDAPPA